MHRFGVPTYRYDGADADYVYYRIWGPSHWRSPLWDNEQRFCEKRCSCCGQSSHEPQQVSDNYGLMLSKAQRAGLCSAVADPDGYMCLGCIERALLALKAHPRLPFRREHASRSLPKQPLSEGYYLW